MANSLDQLPPDKIVDWSILDRWRQTQTEGEAGFVQEMIELYLSGAFPLLTAIRQAVANGDAGGLRQAAHALKGDSKNLGVRQVASLCEALEAESRRGSFDEVPTLLASLECEFERAAQALQSYVSLDDTPENLGMNQECKER